jgi:hypothetical protein
MHGMMHILRGITLESKRAIFLMYMAAWTELIMPRRYLEIP